MVPPHEFVGFQISGLSMYTEESHELDGLVDVMQVGSGGLGNKMEIANVEIGRF
jgi:hypothetical protein